MINDHNQDYHHEEQYRKQNNKTQNEIAKLILQNAKMHTAK